MPAPSRIRSCYLSLGLVLGTASLPAESVAINAQIFNGYGREQLSDGTFKPEYYTFGDGGCWSRAIKDPWMERLKFIDVARAVAAPLAKLNFLPTHDTANCKLLIMVYWGSTQGSSDFDHNDTVNRAGAAIANYDRAQEPDEKEKRSLDRKSVDARTPEGASYEAMLWQLGVNNRMRDELDERNALILGYTEALDRARFAQITALSRDVLQELSGNRYYIVLQAYDFKIAAKDKKLRPLWTTRLSVSEQGEFGAALTKMIWSGNRYFGRDTAGLKREREATVELPPIKFLEDIPPGK